MQDGHRVTSGGLGPAAVRASCGVGAVADLGGQASHRLIELAFEVLANLDHRGARGAEEKTGDGAGMLLQKPDAFLRAQLRGLPPRDKYGVGQIFLAREATLRDRLRRWIDRSVAAEGFETLAWRRVPTDASDLGLGAREAEPDVWQLFVGLRESATPVQFDARLYLLRRAIENRARAEGHDEHALYFCSLDRRRIVYKGLLTCTQLRRFYPDLSDARVESALALVHSRFSTNTLGAWHLAHPYRCLVHNGEINTLRGNRNWMRAREADLACDRFGSSIDQLKPLIAEHESDSCALDHVLELLVESGRSLPHALRMMIPEAWDRDKLMAPERRAFYDYHTTIMEPWDGPALVVASDGERIAAVLDRNGLRPCRMWLTRDHLLILGSETGLAELAERDILVKGRLAPGQIFLADTAAHRIVPEHEIFAALTAPAHAQWLEHARVRLADCRPAPPAAPACGGDLAPAQRAFGYTLESLHRFLEPMARDAKDPIGSMGSDTPPAALSARQPPLFNYFSQLFAQVSNPPLDYLREQLMTSLGAHLGRQHNLLAAGPEHCRQVLIDSPVLSAGELGALLKIDRNGIRAAQLAIAHSRETPFEDAIGALRAAAERAIDEGFEILVLSDRDLSAQRIALPSLLAVGAVHQHLIRRGLRTRVGLVIDSGEACTVHHVCLLLGYGADAIHPWLACASVEALANQDWLAVEADQAERNYRAALEDGILKVMSKMGISAVQAYRGAQVFEALGLDAALIDEFFAGTPCAIGGAGLARIERETRARHAQAFAGRSDELPLDPGGELYWRRDGELHQWTPQTIGLLQHAAHTGDEAAYCEFAAAINEQQNPSQTLRGLLDFVNAGSGPIPLAAVEPEEAILRRFSTGSMSFGALSREAHEALAVAMQRIGGKAGSGEGGEQVERFGSERACSMKQVASGRFGVTIHYLAQARQIEIKMAQGAKPGEGGELPGGKVNQEIARVRMTTPGVGLISPPPHHDIYSIEDLAQLIFDLKNANPEAEIHVKLVAVANVGTIAAGVAKARADAILISGEAGGTGAARKTSIKSAGAPWELGLAETQQVLLANRLRSRVRLRVDGGLKTGRDVAIAALLGAEEFGFGTAALVTLGCIMLRKCHCNTCSVGVATQDPALRAKFAGAPEHVITYMRFVARELRAIMARLGFATVDQMVGRVDRLRQRPAAGKAPLDLAPLLARPASDDAPRKMREQDHGLETIADHALIRDAEPALARGEPVALSISIRNRDRALGTMLSWALTRRRGAAGLPPATITVRCRGSAGQSFGAFLAPGIALLLRGDANDHVGKGLSGGRIAAAPPAEAARDAAEHILIGNVALYGATAGEGYFSGRAGERFAVRNSGAIAVVEGVGDHACEYMTGGAVLVIGPTGRNFGAGMSGGEAYVHDPDDRLALRLNRDMVSLEALVDPRDRALVQRLLENHLGATGSHRAAALLARWPGCASEFVKVMPLPYAEVIAREHSAGRDVRMPLPARLCAAAEAAR